MKSNMNWLAAPGRAWMLACMVMLPARGAMAQYDQAPPVQKVGESATIAAWPPPAALKSDPRILDTLTKEIFLQPGKAFGVVDDKNQPLKPVPTNDWWSDLIMNGDGGQLWQLPMVPKVMPNFIEIRTIGGLRAGSNGGARETVSPIRVGGWNGKDAGTQPGVPPVEELGKARASGWSDWMLTFRKTSNSDAAKTIDITTVRCMPFVWFEINGMDPLLSFDKATVAYFDANGKELTGNDFGTRDTLAIRVDGKFYGVHVAEGSIFHKLSTGDVQIKLPADHKYLVISALPSLEQLPNYAACAYAKPIKTQVNYRYSPASPDGNAVHAQWMYEIQALRPGASSVMQGWLAPHFRETKSDITFLAGAEYQTPRGLLRCAISPASKGFSIDYPFSGILSHVAAPELTGRPNDFDADYLRKLLVKYDEKSQGTAGDTYFGAKSLVLHARAMHMAKELGMTETYENIKQEIKASLADWFTYTDGETQKYFARNQRWGSLIGFPFVHDFNLGRFTDIHFHYGYYVLAYAYVAMDDPAFRDKYKEIAIELARCYAEWDRDSKAYPWFRTFEPMVGHSYAGGSGSGGGNNQESSSESIQAWAGLFLLGEALRGNDPRADAILAAGAFGYAIETRAVLEYYQDYHGSPFASAPLDYDNKPVQSEKRSPTWPDEFRYGRTVKNYPNEKMWVFTNGIMGDSGNTFATYFGANAEFVYGIQWLPNAPHMLFLARDPKFALGQFTALMSYRDKHYTNSWLSAVDGAPRALRAQWYRKPTERAPDSRAMAIDNPWSGQDMKGIVQNLYKLNPAFVKDISHEGDPVRDNPLYDQTNQKWLVEFPADRPGMVNFPKDIWQPDVLVAKYPHLVPPKTDAELKDYSLAIWSSQAFLPPTGPGVDWNAMRQQMSWNPSDYPRTPEGRQKSIAQLTNALEGMGGSWPLIALTFAGFADPELGIDVMAESRKRNNQFAEHTETGMYAYDYFYSLRGLGHPVTDQHVSIPSSQVFLNETTGERSYMVHNKSDQFALADVFENGNKIGQVLAAPGKVTVQKGLFATSTTFAPLGTVPMKDSRDVSLVEDTIAVVFSQPYEASGVENRVRLSGPGKMKLDFQPGGHPQIATFKVHGIWVPEGKYTLTVSPGITNSAKSASITQPMEFSFNMAKSKPCTLVGSSPSNGATNVQLANGQIKLAFSNKIDPATLKGISLTGPGSPTFAVDSASLTGSNVKLNVTSELRPNADYTLTLPPTVADVYQQTLGAPATIAFKTAQADRVLSDGETVLDITRFKRVAGSEDRSNTFEGGLRWEFNSLGDFVEVSIKADRAGVYKLAGSGKEYSLRGTFSVSVNGQRTSNAWNQFDEAGLRSNDLGEVKLIAGENVLRFEVIDLNPASKEKPWLVIKDLTFTPLGR